MTLPERFYDEATAACSRAFDTAAARLGIQTTVRGGMRPGTDGVVRFGGPWDAEAKQIAPYSLSDSTDARCIKAIEDLAQNVDNFVSRYAAKGVCAMAVSDRAFRVAALYYPPDEPRRDDYSLIWLADVSFTYKEKAMTDEAPNLELTEDDVDVALREGVRQGRLVRVKDEQGRDIYKVAPPA